MIVVAIVGILAAIAVPVYRTQTIKAKMTEGTRAVSTLSTSVGDYYQDTIGWPPACPDVTAIDNTLGVAVATNRYIQAVNTQANGEIRVQFQNIGTPVDNNWLVLQPSTSANGAITWSWSGIGMLQKFIPKE